ncbi:MAG: FtsX-like permease family protein [Patescibacteria group bacterium]|jgi:ABC-type lipoprotein release transport system permease subunit
MSFKERRRQFVQTVRVGWFLAYRTLKRSSRATTGLIIFIMVLTFLNLVVVSGLLIGLISGSFQQFRDGYSGEIMITASPGRNFIENSPALVNYIAAHPDVKAMSVRHTSGVQVLGTLTDLPRNGERPNRISVRLVGLNVKDEESVTGFSRFLVKGNMLVDGQEGGILVGANMLRKYSSFADANIPGLDLLDDVDVGSRVRVSLTTAGGEKVSQEFTVRGIVKSKVDEISTRFFVTDPELKRMLPVNKEQVQEIAIRMDYAEAPALVSELQGFMGEHDALIQTYEDAIPSFLRDIETTMGVLGNALSSIALVVASITIFIVIFINAITRRKYIGIMKGIGISPQAIQLSYVFQAFFYGMVGSVVGIAVTFGFLKPYFAAHPINFPFSDGILVATPEGAALRIAILLAVTLAAGYIPARLIVRRNTLDAILGR